MRDQLSPRQKSPLKKPAKKNHFKNHLKTFQTRTKKPIEKTAVLNNLNISYV